MRKSGVVVVLSAVVCVAGSVGVRVPPEEASSLGRPLSSAVPAWDIGRSESRYNEFCNVFNL